MVASQQTTHLRFINRLSASAAKPNLARSDEMSAHKFHADLFASGFERILVVSLDCLAFSLQLIYVFYHR
jgi:hypothetical protein